MRRYVLTAEAQKDLRDIRDYVLREGGFRVARYVVGSIVTALRSLTRTPGLGHRREDLSTRDELLFWTVFSYVIVYRTDKKTLTVLAILHGNRDVGQILKAR